MGAFDRITGQARAAGILQRAILADRVSHAWLLSGSSASDLLGMALAFAQTLQCTQKDPRTADACMQCRSCLQAMEGNHPDIRIWGHEKPTTFSVDEVRSLVSDVSIRPFSSDRKLLKTLEEPPDYIVILLLTHSTDAMLETVRSRCQLVELAAGQAQYDPLLRQNAERLLLQIRSLELVQIHVAIKELEPMKPQIGEVLELFASWYRDLLYFKATQDPDGLLFPEHLSQIQSDAGRMSYEGIQSVLDSIRKAYQRLAANVSFDLTMELLLLSMKDAAA